MDLKFTKRVLNQEGESGTAEMLLFGVIGMDIDGNSFAKEMKYLADDLKVKKIKVFINSVGGSVYDGYSIVSVMEMLKQKGIEIETVNVGIAYSMAGIVLACGTGSKRKIYDYASSMIHAPSRDGEKDSDEVKEAYKSLKTILVNNTLLDDTQVEDLMSKDSFFDSSQSVAYGMVDEIIKTGKQVDQSYSPFGKLAACAMIFDKNFSTNIIKKDMSKINAMLNLNSEAAETAQIEAIQKLVDEASKVSGLQNDLTKEKAKVTALTNELATLKQEQGRTNAETLVNQAVSDGKISKESASKWIENAVKDFDGTKELIDSLTTVPGSINSQLDARKGNTADPENKVEKDLADKYNKMLVENTGELEKLDADTEKKMYNAWAKHYAPKVDVAKG